MSASFWLPWGLTLAPARIWFLLKEEKMCQNQTVFLDFQWILSKVLTFHAQDEFSLWDLPEHMFHIIFWINFLFRGITLSSRKLDKHHIPPNAPFYVHSRWLPISFIKQNQPGKINTNKNFQPLWSSGFIEKQTQARTIGGSKQVRMSLTGPVSSDNLFFFFITDPLSYMFNWETARIFFIYRRQPDWCL